MKKILSVMLSLVMVFGLSVAVFAAPGDQSPVPVTLTVAPATFSVTLPTSLPIDVAADGTVTTSTTATITNNSNAPVEVTNVVVTAAAPWSQVAWDVNSLKGELAGTQKYALKFGAVDSYWSNAGEKATQGAAIAALYPVLSAAGLGSNSTIINYSAQVAPQPSSVPLTTIANVVFTVAWAD